MIAVLLTLVDADAPCQLSWAGHSDNIVPSLVNYLNGVVLVSHDCIGSKSPHKSNVSL